MRRPNGFSTVIPELLCPGGGTAREGCFSVRALALAATVLVSFVTGATAFAQGITAGPQGPSLGGFIPTQGAQGTTVNITFTGKGFANKGLSLRFSPAPGLNVQSLQAASATQISALVKIDAAAQLGAHAVLLTVGDRTLKAPTSFTVTGAPPCGVPGGLPCPASERRNPVLRDFSPRHGDQGSNVTVTFTGANFTAPANVHFKPGAGIVVQSATVINEKQIQAQLAIDADAPLGARAVSLQMGKTQLAAENKFLVVHGREPGPMQILRVTPNELAAGSEGVELILEGANFVSGTQVSFTRAGLPTDVQVVGLPRYVDSTELHVIVNVLSTALPGGRDINLETPSHQTVTGKGMLNVLPPADAK
jgi:hypothetical protein